MTNLLNVSDEQIKKYISLNGLISLKKELWLLSPEQLMAFYEKFQPEEFSMIALGFLKTKSPTHWLDVLERIQKNVDSFKLEMVPANQLALFEEKMQLIQSGLIKKDRHPAMYKWMLGFFVDRLRNEAVRSKIVALLSSLPNKQQIIIDFFEFGAVGSDRTAAYLFDILFKNGVLKAENYAMWKPCLDAFFDNFSTESKYAEILFQFDSTTPMYIYTFRKLLESDKSSVLIECMRRFYLDSMPDDLVKQLIDKLVQFKLPMLWNFQNSIPDRLVNYCIEKIIETGKYNNISIVFRRVSDFNDDGVSDSMKVKLAKAFIQSTISANSGSINYIGRDLGIAINYLDDFNEQDEIVDECIFSNPEACTAFIQHYGANSGGYLFNRKVSGDEEEDEEIYVADHELINSVLERCLDWLETNFSGLAADQRTFEWDKFHSYINVKSDHSTQAVFLGYDSENDDRRQQIKKRFYDLIERFMSANKLKLCDLYNLLVSDYGGAAVLNNGEHPALVDRAVRTIAALDNGEDRQVRAYVMNLVRKGLVTPYNDYGVDPVVIIESLPEIELLPKKRAGMSVMNYVEKTNFQKVKPKMYKALIETMFGASI